MASLPAVLKKSFNVCDFKEGALADLNVGKLLGFHKIVECRAGKARCFGGISDRVGDWCDDHGSLYSVLVDATHR